MKVVAVVVTYNRLNLLKECIAALKNQDYQDLEILIVNNNSNDGTEEYIKSVEDKKKVFLLSLEKNIGGAGGFHEGMRQAMRMQADWLWLMDDDTIPDRTSLSELCSATQVIKDKIGFLCSNVYGVKSECMNTPRMKFMERGDNGYADWNMHLEHSLVKVNTATFCSIMVSSDAVKYIGLPIKEYFIWGDDTEYTLRLSRYYGQGWLVGKSKVLHKRENGQTLSIIKETNSNRIPVYFYYTRNYLVNLSLYFGYWASFAKTLHFNLMILKILFGKSNYKWKKIKTLVKGITAFWLRKYDVKSVKNRINNMGIV